MAIVDFPFIWARKLTIPPCEKDEYEEHKIFTVIWPFLGIPVTGMLAMKCWPTWSWLYYLPFAFLWAIYFQKFAPVVESDEGDEPAVPKAYIVT